MTNDTQKGLRDQCTALRARNLRLARENIEIRSRYEEVWQALHRLQKEAFPRQTTGLQLAMDEASRALYPKPLYPIAYRHATAT
jgi:hypothetical protein